MIHLHSLLPSEIDPATAGQNSGTPSNHADHDAFRGVLSEAANDGSGSHGPITPASWDKIARATPPAPDTASSSSASSAGSSSTAGSAGTGSSSSNSDWDPFLQYVNSTSAPAETPSTSSTATTNAPAAAASSSAITQQEAFDNAYWAAQPPAVQALRTAPADERVQMATQLANEGYSIDVPIMVWGWDPYTTTNTRVADGYTWVPSALQSSLTVAPGITFDGNSYNASDSPTGSITV